MLAKLLCECSLCTKIYFTECANLFLKTENCLTHWNTFFCSAINRHCVPHSQRKIQSIGSIIHVCISSLILIVCIRWYSTTAFICIDSHVFFMYFFRIIFFYITCDYGNCRVTIMCMWNSYIVFFIIKNNSSWYLFNFLNMRKVYVITKYSTKYYSINTSKNEL